ncbi:MAG: autotransporter-associated beta strand repeat-containing protein [Burkholderiales bacterium]|nr:autotransporter-associated beta strand repeat-containing protein [Opitutaceae bacterium]
MKSRSSLQLLAAIAALSSLGLTPLSLHAASGNWTGATDNTWEGANWSVTPAPGSTTFAFNQADIATFNTTGSNVVSIDAGRNIRSIAFTTAASTYTIGANGGNSLLLAHSGSISTNLAGQQETIAAPLVLQPASATTAGTYQFIASGSGSPTTTSATLNFTGPISGGTTTQGIALTLSGNSNNPTGSIISGVVSNGGAATGFSVIKANSSLWSLTGTNSSFTGGVRIDQGTLNVATISTTGNNSSIGAGGGIVFVAGSSGNPTLNINGAGGTTDRAITFNNNTGGTNHGIISSSGTGPVELTGTIAPGTLGNTTAAIIEFAGTNVGANVVSGNISDANGRTTSVIKSGAGTWTLSGNNTYTGTTTLGTAGTLNLGSSTALGTGTLIISGNGTFDNTSGAAFTRNIAGLTLSGGSPTFTGTNSLNLGSGPVTLSGANRTITVTNASATLSIGAIGEDSIRSFTKLGAGTLATLGGSYTGTTTVSAGTLLVNGVSSGTGAITVASGATLGGTGTLGGATTFSSGGATFAPATLGVAGVINTANLTFNAGSLLSFDLGINTAASDQAVVTGSLNFAGATTLNLTNLAIPTLGSTIYTLFSVSGTTTNIGNVTIGALAGYDSSLSLSGNNVVLTLTSSAIPEPSSAAALAGLSILGFAALRRRRRA